MGDLEEYEGVLFLTSSCIDALLNAGGEKYVVMNLVVEVRKSMQKPMMN